MNQIEILKYNLGYRVYGQKGFVVEDIIRELLVKAADEEDLELASITNDLMAKMAGTYNCPSNWRNILEDMFTEFQDNKWLMDAIYEFSIMAEDN